MSYRWKGKYFELDPENPAAEGICDRCGFRFNLKNLTWQFAYQGSNMPQNTRFLVCSKGCNDPLNPQDMPFILPPDPVPVMNARVEPYTLDETSWLATQEDDVLTTQSGEQFITAIPNPSNNANTASLVATLVYPSGSVATAYLDLFNGNPTSGGVSVLALITGSSTRTDVSSSLATISGVAKNTDVITVSSSSEGATNVNYAAIYSASISGALLVSGPISVSGQSVGLGTVVQFDSLGLSINLN